MHHNPRTFNPAPVAVPRFAVEDLNSTLFWLRLVQLLLAIPLLAIMGQGALFLIARALGQDVGSNIFFRVLEIVVMPFTRFCRLITPRIITDRQVPLVVLSLLSVGYIWVMFAIVNVCVGHGVAVAHCLQSR